MATGKKAGKNTYQALSPFTYDGDSGLLVRGQVFDLKGHENDQLLVGMDYIRPVAPGTELLECGECGGLFLTEYAREQHGRHFHDHWCDCGWVPDQDVYDKDQALKDHIKTCEVWRTERARAAQRHLQVAMSTA